MGPVVSPDGARVDNEQQGEDTGKEVDPDERAVHGISNSQGLGLTEVDSQADARTDGTPKTHDTPLLSDIHRLPVLRRVRLGRVARRDPEEAGRDAEVRAAEEREAELARVVEVPQPANVYSVARGAESEASLGAEEVDAGAGDNAGERENRYTSA